MEEKIEELGFVRDLGKASRTILLREMRIQQGRRNQMLVQQGDTLASVFLLLDGVLRVYAIGPQGREATLYRVHPGEVCLLSLNAAFGNQRYPAWVSVQSARARFALLPAKVMRSLFPSEPAIQEMVLGSLTATVRGLLANFDDVLNLRLSVRLERFLIGNCDSSGRLHMTHQMLADHLGATREAVSREIAVLKKRKKMLTGRGYLQLVSR